MPSQSPASAAIPRLARPPQVPAVYSGRPSTGAVPQPPLQQQVPQLTQQQLQQWHAQQLKAYQQRLLEQQMFAQQNLTSPQVPFGAAPQYDREDIPSTALPFCVSASDAHHSLSAQEMLMQRMLYQQMYDAALAEQQQQQHIKATVSAGAINLIQQQAIDGSVQSAGSSSCQFVTPEADHAMRRASEGQVCTTSTTCEMSSVQNVGSASHSVTSSVQSQSADAVPASTVTYAGDTSPTPSRDETFKVPSLRDHVRYYQMLEYY